MPLHTPSTESNNPLRGKMNKILGLGAMFLVMSCKGSCEEHATTVPSASANVALSASQKPAKKPSTTATRAQVNQCLVKGNITADGRRLYHVGGCPDYKNTKTNRKGERCFDSEEEAIKAGWTKAGSCK